MKKKKKINSKVPAAYFTSANLISFWFPSTTSDFDTNQNGRTCEMKIRGSEIISHSFYLTFTTIPVYLEVYLSRVRYIWSTYVHFTFSHTK